MTILYPEQSTPLKNRQQTSSQKETGALGEDYAASYLAQLGWKILDRNWSCRYGELDIVALCPDHSSLMRDILVFVEVKTRQNTHFGEPVESITPHKVQCMKRAGILWLTQHRATSSTPVLVRFDAVGIVMKNGVVSQLTHIRKIA